MLFSAIDTIVTDLTDANTTDFPTATRLIYANQAQAETSGLIIGADGRWQWDDTNYTDLPIGKADLVDDQRDYSFDDEMLYVETVSILNSAGEYQLLRPIDINRFRHEDRDEYQKTKGVPEEYDKDGRSIILYPPADSTRTTLTNGLKIGFRRKTKDITSFGSTSPGFIETEHMILPYKIALPYVTKYKPERVAPFMRIVQKHEDALRMHYGRRSKDERTVLRNRRRRFI